MKISPSALKAATDAATRLVPGARTMPPAALRAVAQGVIEAYEAKRATPGIGRRPSGVSAVLLEMQVGDVRVIPAAWLSTAYNRMVWARKRTREQRRWSLRTLNTGEGELTRMPDGWAYRQPITSVLTKALVASKVGDVFTVPDIPVNRTTDTQYRRARELMGEPHAQWTYVTTTKGRRITRVA